MNIPLRMSCQSCKEPFNGTFPIGSTDVEWTCANCGHPNFGILNLDTTVGVQVWVKSSYELNQSKDFSMAVVLAATAVECELFRLFSKWTYIQKLEDGYLHTDDECAKILRQIRGIQMKFKAVTDMLVPQGFQSFVNVTEKWRETVSQDFTELSLESLIPSIDEQLFWPRNNVLHSGRPASPEQAERCVKISQLCLQIFLDMDYVRRDVLDRHIKARHGSS